MLHLRVVAPSPQAAEVVDYLIAHPATTNVVHLIGAARDPKGDFILCDLAREGGNEVIAHLRGFDIHRTGSIALDEVMFSISDGVARAEDLAPGLGADAVVWEQVEARMRVDGQISWNFVAYVVLAVLIASLGILLDSAILIVGAMVVGPEYGPLSAISFWLHRRRPRRVRYAARTLLVGLTVGIAAAVLAGWLADWIDLVPERLYPATLPQTGFVFDPNALSLVIAVLAGVAGMLSVSSARTGIIIGVLISVTTIPAAAGIGVAIAVWDWQDARGALVQLVVNVVGIIAAGYLTLKVQSRFWKTATPPAP